MDKNKPTNIALYMTFSDEFIEQSLSLYERHIHILLKRDITFALLKYAYRKYYGIDIDTKALNSGNYFKQKEYGGLRFDFTTSANWVMIAISDIPVSIGKSVLPIDSKRSDDSKYLHVNEYRQYEQSGYSVDELLFIWSKKFAFMKLHDIENPSVNPFDRSYFKDFDSTSGKYSLHRFEYQNYAHYVAVTGDTQFETCDVADVFESK